MSRTKNVKDNLGIDILALNLDRLGRIVLAIISLSPRYLFLASQSMNKSPGYSSFLVD